MVGTVASGAFATRVALAPSSGAGGLRLGRRVVGGRWSRVDSITGVRHSRPVGALPRVAAVLAERSLFHPEIAFPTGPVLGLVVRAFPLPGARFSCTAAPLGAAGEDVRPVTMHRVLARHVHFLGARRSAVVPGHASCVFVSPCPLSRPRGGGGSRCLGARVFSLFPVWWGGASVAGRYEVRPLRGGVFVCRPSSRGRPIRRGVRPLDFRHFFQENNLKMFYR